jgi:hypothetical protein
VQHSKHIRLPSRRVKSREGLPEMIPINILNYYVVDKQRFPHKYMVYISWAGLIRWTSQSHQDITNHLTHSWKIETTHAPIETTHNIGSWGFNFSQSLCTPKFIGFLSDENNQSLYLYLFICVGCAMFDSLKLLIDLCNECWVGDTQTKWF